MIKYIITILVVIFILIPRPSFAVTPEDILVVYNTDMPGSKEVADFYMAKREVPAKNLLGLHLPVDEKILRKDFESKLKKPISEAVAKLRNEGRTPVILLVYGVPLLVQMNYKYREEGVRGKADQKITGLKNQAIDLINDLRGVNGKPDRLSAADFDAAKVGREAHAVLQELSEHREKVSSQVKVSLLKLLGISFVVKNIASKERVGPEALFLTKELMQRSTFLDAKLLKANFFGTTQSNLEDIAETVRESMGVLGELDFWNNINQLDSKEESSASVDSELSLVLVEDYRKTKWLLNPFAQRFDKLRGIEYVRRDIVKVARIDAPNPKLAKKLISDAVLTENIGLRGIFYIDSRGIKQKQGDAYTYYDKLLVNLNNIVQKYSDMRVVFDKSYKLFAEDSAPDAALYCGWYSVGKYVDAFKWKRGAVGFHIASSEAKTLRESDSNVWCKRMIEEGVSATLGPVQEPYLQSFPRPDIFFPLIMTGKMSLVDVYYKTSPFISWRQVLVGDPLYTPFKLNPVIKPGWERLTH